MDDVLVVGSSFDPSGLTRGLAAGEAALKHFEQAVRQLDIQTRKALDFGTLGALSAKAFRDSAAAVAAYETRVRDAVQSVVGLNQANVDAFAGSIQAATGSAKYAAGLVALNQHQIQSTNYTSRWTAGLQALQAQQAALTGSTAALSRAGTLANTGMVTSTRRSKANAFAPSTILSSAVESALGNSVTSGG